MPEKNIPSETRLTPWESLHHPGYWLKRSASSTRTRRALAQSIDPAAPLQESEAPNSRRPLYDTFLCPEPEQELQLDHSSLLVNTLYAADRHFTSRSQPRASESLRLEIGLEHIQSGRWAEATEVLKPLWQSLSWRPAQWWSLVAEASAAMKICAAKVADWELYLAAEWELLCRCMSCPSPSYQVANDSALPAPARADLDFHACMGGYELSRRPHVSLNADNVAPTCESRSFS